MSKSFLTVEQAYTKLELSGGEGNTNWITKSELIATKRCYTPELHKYGENDFVVDDDIIRGPYWKTIFSFSGTSSGDTTKTMIQDFDTSKQFRITGRVTWNSVIWGQGRAFSIYNNDGKYLLQLNVNDANNSEKTPYISMYICGTNENFTIRNPDLIFNIGESYAFYVRGNNSRVRMKINSYSQDFHSDFKVGKFSKLMLSGSPEYSNGDCTVTFSNFKIELLIE